MRLPRLLGILFIVATALAFLLQFSPFITGSFAGLVMLTIIYETARILTEATKPPRTGQEGPAGLEETTQEKED